MSTMALVSKHDHVSTHAGGGWRYLAGFLGGNRESLILISSLLENTLLMFCMQSEEGNVYITFNNGLISLSSTEFTMES